MELKRILLLIVIAAALFIVSFALMLTRWAVVTPMIVLTILIAVVAILLVRDLKLWIESLVNRIADGDSARQNELARMNESLESVKTAITRIEEHLDKREK